MDFVNKLSGNNSNTETTNQQQQPQTKQEGGGFMDKLQGMGGGGASGERDEDALDKSMFLQCLESYVHC